MSETQSDPPTASPSQVAVDEKQIAVDIPDADGRAEIFDIHAEDLPTAERVTTEWFTRVADRTLSGADIAGICEDALMLAIRDVENGVASDVIVTREHIQRALAACDADPGDEGSRYIH